MFSNLPRRVEFSLNVKEPEDASQEEKELFRKNYNYISQFLWYWDTEDRSFSFKLPPTIFIDRPRIITKSYTSSRRLEYENEEDSTGIPLRKEHLETIWRKGEFSVPSKIPDFPYVWKLTSFTVKGIENVKESYFNDLSFSFMMLYYLKYRFILEDYDAYPVSLPGSFYSLYDYVYKILNLFIGLPMFDNIDNELADKINHDNLLNFILENPQINIRLFSSATTRMISQAERPFYDQWKTNMIEKEKELIAAKRYSRKEINRIINEYKRELLLNFFNTDEKFQELNQKFNLLDFFYSKEIYNIKDFNHRKELNQRMKDFDLELQKSYIRYRVSGWREAKTEDFRNKMEETHNTQIFEEVSKAVANYKVPHKVYLNNHDKEIHFANRMKELRKTEKREPSYTFTVHRYCTRPYELIEIKRENLDSDYKLKKKEEYHVTTSCPFWRITLMIVEFFIYFWNINFLLLKFAFYSMFGIFALCSLELYWDEKLEYSTSRVPKKRVITYPRALSNLFLWIVTDRDDFEAAPDTGIFSKAFSRIFNLIKNYIFKALIIGVILLVGYPALILLNFAICISLVLVSPALALLCVILEYLFNLLIYNNLYKSFIFPLISYTIYTLLIKGVLQLALTLILIVIQPVLSLLALVFAHLRFLLRELYDFLMFQLVKCIGKIPVTDSCVAWKISGDNLFRHRFADIDNAMILLLVRGTLESTLLDNFKEQMKIELDSPLNNIVHKLNKIYRQLGFVYTTDAKIERSIRFYKDKLRELVDRRREKYPYVDRNFNIKFSRERLQKVIELIRLYLIEFSKTNEMEVYFNSFQSPMGDYDNLVEKIMGKIFGNEIFTTLEENDKVVHLESVTNDVVDIIAKKIFEDPLFKNVEYVEEKKEKEELETFPDIPQFGEIFESLFFLNLSYLTEKEREQYLGNEDPKVSLLIF